MMLVRMKLRTGIAGSWRNKWTKAIMRLKAILKIMKFLRADREIVEELKLDSDKDIEQVDETPP